MTFELDIDVLDLEEIARKQFDGEVKIRVQAAMANRFASIVHNNFGMDGEDRPVVWPPLSRDYAEQYHGGSRIPQLILTGDLRDSIQIDDTSYDAASVWTDIEYAQDHQVGNDSIPARPFFPMFGIGSGAALTPYALDEAIRAAQYEIERTMK